MKLILSARDSRELADELTKTILESALKRGYTFESIFCGLLANMIGPIPDDAWDKMMKDRIQPCCEPDCDCHIIGAKIFEALDELRDDWELRRPHKRS